MLPSPPLVRAAISVARWLPPVAYRALATLAGSLGWAVAGTRRAVALENMRHLAPDAPPQVQRRLARSLLRHLIEDASDLFRLPSLSRKRLEALIRAEGLAELRRAHAAGKGVIVVTPHLGPYELGAALVAALGLPVHAMVEDIDPDTNAALAAYRQATGLRLLSRNTGLRQLYRLLHQGDIVLLVADRVIGNGSDGMVVSFGDAARAVPTGPAAFAIATGAPVVVAHIVRGAPGSPRYFLGFDAPLSPDGADRETLTRAVAARFDSLVREHPDQWYVFQPDWLPRDAGH